MRVAGKGTLAMKRWKFWSGMMALFFSGVLIGAVGNSIYIRHEIREVRLGGHPAVRQFILKRLTNELRLSDEQKARIGKIVCRAQTELSQFKAEHHSEIEVIFAHAISDMKQYLTAEQQKKLDELYEKARRRGKLGRSVTPPPNEPCE